MVLFLYFFYFINCRFFDIFFFVVIFDFLNVFLGREGRNRMFDVFVIILMGRFEWFLLLFGIFWKVNDCIMIIMFIRLNILLNILFRCWILVLSVCDYIKYSGIVFSFINFCYRGYFVRYIILFRRKIVLLILLFLFVSFFNCIIFGWWWFLFVGYDRFVMS